MSMSRVVSWSSILVLGLALAFAPAAFADSSSALSRQSGASLAVSVEVPAAALVALSDGGRFVVQSVDASAGIVVVVVVSGAAEATSFALTVSRDVIDGAGIGAGAAVLATAVASGWVLYAGSEAIGFVANALVQPHVHSRRLAS